MNLTVMLDGSERIHYRDPSVPIYVSRGDLRSLSNLSALCHWHEDIELLYGFSADGTDCEYICVTFRPQLLCANEEIRNRFILPVLTGPNFTHLVLRKVIPEHRPLLNAVCRLDALYSEKAPGYEIQALGVLFQFWHGLYQLAQEKIGEAASADVNILIQKQMLEFIRTHYQEKTTIDAIAAAGGVCRTKCCQIFRQYLGCTPNDYLNSFRLEKGMELLKSTKMTISEIAGECGFNSASYFTEMFTRQKGCSPKAYRNSHL